MVGLYGKSRVAAPAVLLSEPVIRVLILPSLSDSEVNHAETTPRLVGGQVVSA